MRRALYRVVLLLTYGACLLLCVHVTAVLSALLSCTHAQFAQQVLDAGVYNQTINSTTLATAVALAADKVPPGSRILTPQEPAPIAHSEIASAQWFQIGVQLPACPASNVLLTDDGVPENWGELTMTEQVTHPANALILQLAYAGSIGLLLQGSAALASERCVVCSIAAVDLTQHSHFLL